MQCSRHFEQRTVTWHEELNTVESIVCETRAKQRHLLGKMENYNKGAPLNKLKNGSNHVEPCSSEKQHGWNIQKGRESWRIATAVVLNTQVHSMEYLQTKENTESDLQRPGNIFFYVSSWILWGFKDNAYHPSVENLFIRQIIHRKLCHLEQRPQFCSVFEYYATHTTK